MNDRITLTGLRVHGHHGVYEHEKRDGQEFVVDLTVWLELGPAAADDDLRRTVNYGELAERAVEIVGGPSRDLVETTAVALAEAVLAEQLVEAVEVTLHKPNAPIPREFSDVAVTVRRCRSSGRAVSA